VEARHHIGIAQGVLMQRWGITKEAAFGLLQRYSNVTNVKVRDLAVLVFERGDLPSEVRRPGPGAVAAASRESGTRG
jgi:AmiR/NasT family two-component response regulator